MSFSGLEYLSTLAQWRGHGGFALEKISPIINQLRNPENSVPCIHIAGTNGKGSVSAALASVLGAAGYRVGLYTSPHLVRMNERIVIDGLAISDEELDSLAREVKSASKSAGVEPTFFEAMTVMAFLAFRAARLDWCVLEVGLGGRLDATNVVEAPRCCVITSIDLDHEQILGDTLGKIACEKAGILKRGVPAVIGPMADESLAAIEGVANKLGCRLSRYGRDFEVSNSVYSGEGRQVAFAPTLAGEHQAHNMAVALEVARVLNISIEASKYGVEHVYWPGRLERVEYKGARLTVDSAHNPAGIRSFISFLESHKLSKVNLGFGAIRTKRWEEMVQMLIPYVEQFGIMTPDYPDPVPSAEICSYLSGNGVKCCDYGTDYEAFLATVNKGSPHPSMVVGSMYLIGKIRELTTPPIGALWTRQVG